MSKISLSGNASGTGTLNIAAPNTNSDITLNLPTTMGTNNGGSVVTTDSSGNLGLGVAPSAWNSGNKSLDINTTASFFNAAGGAGIGANAYRDSGGAWRYRVSDFASLYLTNNSQHQWYTAASGTAGNAISLTQAMTLGSDNRLLLNTTSNPNSARLYVADSGGYLMNLHQAATGATGCDLLFTHAGDSNKASIKLTGDTNGSALAFETGTGPTERARIDSSGNLLVGTTTSASNKIRFVDGNSGSGTGAFSVTSAVSSNQLLYVRSDGYVSMEYTYNSITSAAAANMVIGNGGYIYRSTSSLKYKRDVESATHGLDDVMKLRSVTYKGKSESDGEKVFGGLIAEEVHAAGLSEFVAYNEAGEPDALHYGHMVSLAFKAIQEQQAMIEQLKADVATLKGTV